MKGGPGETASEVNAGYRTLENPGSTLRMVRVQRNRQDFERICIQLENAHEKCRVLVDVAETHF